MSVTQAWQPGSWNPCKDGRENDAVDLSFMYMFWHGYPTSNTQTINKLKKCFKKEKSIFKKKLEKEPDILA